MADIRINALATTAASTASDDFVAVDGSANGTRKLNAFSPTFGGNLTVSGTGTINGGFTAGTNAGDNFLIKGGNPTIKEYGGGACFLDFGQFGVDTTTNGVLRTMSSGSRVTALTLSGANATLAGNLTVSGAVRAGAIPTVGTEIGDFYQATAGSNAFRAVHVNGNAIRLNPSYNYYDSYDHIFRSLSGTTTYATIKNNGNVLIGTTTDSGNGKLQLATHTTSAGGIGFGTDTPLYRSSQGVLNIEANYNGSTWLRMKNTDAGAGAAAGVLFANQSGDYGAISILSSGATPANALLIRTLSTNSLILRTNGNDALTLDSSQNATFAGDASIVKSSAVLKVYDSQTVVGGGGGEIFLQHRNSGASQTSYASVKGYATNGTIGSEDGDLYLKTMRAGTLTLGLKVTNGGSVVVNDAAVATNATRGFLYVSGCAGTPTGTPETHTGRVPIVVDTTNNKLYFYSGGAWRDAGP